MRTADRVAIQFLYETLYVVASSVRADVALQLDHFPIAMTPR